MKRSVGYFFLLTIVLSFFSVACAQERKVVIVSLNRTSLSQAASDQALAPWLARGSVALMNISTAARPSPLHLYVTMGAGSRAVGTENARLAFHQDEEYGGSAVPAVYLRHTGLLPQGSILHLGIADINRLNVALQHPAQPGLLGDALGESGKVTAVLGNADGHGPSREAAVVLADSTGQVGLGDVSRAVLKRDHRFPFGWRTDREKMRQVFQDVAATADVILVDWGDYARLEEYRPLLAPAVARSLEQEISQDVSWFLTDILAGLSPEDVLLIVSPAPPAGNSGSSHFGYLAAIGDGFPPGTLLISATTRRPGLVAVTDVAATVLEQLGLARPGAMLGMAVSAAGGPGGVPELLRMQANVGRIFSLRPPLLKTYVFFQIVIVLGALLNLFLRLLPLRWFEPLLIGLLTVPLLLLFLPLQPFSVVAGFILTAAAVLAAVFLLQRVAAEPVVRFAAVTVPTSLLIIADLLRGAPLMKVSVLGYDPVSGARYYGLGNEYMGVLVGATVLAAAALITVLPKHRRLLLFFTAAYFLAIVLVIAAPGGGANFGGTVTAVTAFLVTLAVLAQIRPGWRSGVTVALVLAAIVALALFLNLRVPQAAQSHLGRTVGLLQQDGWQVLQDVISRKAAMNIRLFRYSQWSRAFLAFLMVLAVLFYRPRGVLRDIHRRYPDLTAGFLGIIAGSAAAFLVNDSGVVAAATTLLYAGVPIILLANRIAAQSWENTREHK